MMKIILHKNFEKKYIKLKPNEKKKFKGRINLFLKDPFNRVLNNHLLHGKYKKCRSINITADLRVIYEFVKEDTALFIAIDSHSNLYS